MRNGDIEIWKVQVKPDSVTRITQVDEGDVNTFSLPVSLLRGGLCGHEQARPIHGTWEAPVTLARQVRAGEYDRRWIASSDVCGLTSARTSPPSYSGKVFRLASRFCQHR